MDILLQTLAEPGRRRLLDLLRDGERSVGELVEATGASQPAVSKQLRQLREAGLVTGRAEGQRRLYRVRADGLRALDAWLEPYRLVWSSRLDELERHLDESERRNQRRKRDAR
ncbi:MAG TPA: metalloregulator ArsR/SmtB family transcription factor [Longimicrobiales bacterium]